MPSATERCFEGNLLLACLSPKDRGLLLPDMERLEYQRGETLFAAGREVDFITFPLDQTVVTLLISMIDGRSAETATIGREGAVGGVVSNGGLPASTHALIQIAGPILRMESVRLQEVKRRSESLRNLFTRYSDCLLAQVLQSVACNALHPIEERCLRWLLTLQDRLDSNVLPITQEALAAMLGVQRTYLTRILRMLQQQGLIEVGRGRITVLNRTAIETVACECHACVKRHYETVLGAVYSPSGRLVAIEPPE
ncbi:putative transcriptional regulator, Crp/Fnr family [Methylorubrum populi BJ001]|jgi:CRP-like cAMP-binding protein|uniref:Putative transcriptional regulator, Crp/Fnr family n=1 Tax=Methylorubrum populi (strain ATCC BAA-705 / NCIMB 13946 / BJ001) TaxID=441620 RepID=B1ZEU1_METPB|nr:Crp/Fnr family transcriptional regulator [Methylorubrum populi]ACB82470.1 putative transcriptional regulator, Crp/Fnr family [Methylorubrum populi BJ001]OAH30082.1 Crp/Fnr family transcriptional regulator [Methylorubrum populi]PZP70139.1 MAG: Crp/Fnr family transcriptional regulator [Methylorubrum populi]